MELQKRHDDSFQLSEVGGHLTAWLPSCGSCADPDPQVRYTHYLLLVRHGGLPALETHLNECWTGCPNHDMPRQILRWAHDEVAGYSGRVDPETGAPLTWWETRAMTIRITKQRRPMQKEFAEAVVDTQQTIENLLQSVQQQGGPADVRWMRFHIQLFEKGLGRPQCRDQLIWAYRTLAQTDRDLKQDAEREIERCLEGTWGD